MCFITFVRKDGKKGRKEADEGKKEGRQVGGREGK
jgi:hypothetical protein